MAFYQQPLIDFYMDEKKSKESREIQAESGEQQHALSLQAFIIKFV